MSNKISLFLIHDIFRRAEMTRGLASDELPNHFIDSYFWSSLYLRTVPQPFSGAFIITLFSVT